jgi:hypothetical protein
MEVLLTKHTKNDVWAHFENKFSTFEERSNKYREKLRTTIESFSDNKPYERINWRRHYTTGGANSHRVVCHMWVGYDEDIHDEYNGLWDLRNDLRMLKEEFGGKDQYAMFLGQAECFCEDMKALINEYERTERYAWESSYARWKDEDADWIAETDAYKSHKSIHRTIEEQIANNEAWKNGTGSDRFNNFVPTDYTLICKFCKQEAEKKKADEERSAKFIAEMEERRRISDEECRREKEEKRKAEEEQRKKAWENAPVLTCETCKYSTKSQNSYDQHTDSKEHKVAIKMASLHCEKCNVYSRCYAEHQAHLHSKKHLGETEPEKKTLRCDVCDYNAANKGNYDYHMNSKKHKKKVEDQTC